MPEQTVCVTAASAWVDTRNRIVSFSPQAGFQKLNFKSHREMFTHVIRLGFAGYAIL